MKPSSDMRKPYSGPVRALVIAFDVGTTFSGVSYAILEPGEIPKIHGVTRFPGQEHVAGNSKIPSILYYDRDGTVMAAGAEADNASVTSQAEDEGWIKAELFKLRMRPRSMKLNMNGMRLSPLPRHKSAVDVFGEFLRYLFRCTRSFIIDTHANGKALWQAVEHSIEFVLSHPNGWEGAQQTRMRRAAVYGGLISDTDEGRARIRFVTEGEASLHACVQSGLAADILSNPSRNGFLVADAGGGTLDISSYAVRGTNPLVIEEVAPPDCIFAGSVFVSRRAREFLAEKLKGSRYGTSDSIDHITKRFDETTKRLFRDKKGDQWVPFGSPLDRDPSVGIRGGSLKLIGEEVAELFEPSIQAAISSIKAQVLASQGMIKSVWLVGGFAASPWLFTQLQDRLAPMKITVSRPDNQTSKAVADGALGFYCDHHVSARVSKFMYGVEYLREFDPNDPEHVARRERLCELPSGPKLLPDAFDCILARGVKVKESTVFTRKYCTELTNLSTLSVFEVEIWCYRGGDMIPPWILRLHEEYSTLCVVRADLSPLSGSAEPKSGRNGKTYWTIVFSVEIHFGLTEFKARIKWNDNGVTKYGPASIVYSESGHRADEDEPDTYSEDDFGPSRSVSRAPSRPASVAPSRTHSQDSVGSGAKTPQGQGSSSGRLDAVFMDTVSRSRSISSSQQSASAHSRSQSYHQSQVQPPQPPPPQPQPPPPQSPQAQAQAAQAQTHTHSHSSHGYQQSIYSERTTREFERERTVSSSASRVSSSATHVERDRKASSASKLSSSHVSQSRESERERRGREAAERERVAMERDRAERERVAAERGKLERERMEREKVERERVERERFERERIERERIERERIERETVERIEWERAERERIEWERAEQDKAERERERERERAERERIAAEEAAAAAAAAVTPVTTVKGKKGKKKIESKIESKLSPPVDLADTAVGKSPGQLANELNSVWGSQSKAVTPAASPFPSAIRSVGPTTPRTEFPEPKPVFTTTALGETQSSFFTETTIKETANISTELAVDVAHVQGGVVHPEDPAPGHTPADTVPSEQLVSEALASETSVTTEVVNHQFESSATQQTFESFEASETVAKTEATTTMSAASATGTIAAMTDANAAGALDAIDTTDGGIGGGSVFGDWGAAAGAGSGSTFGDWGMTTATSAAQTLSGSFTAAKSSFSSLGFSTKGKKNKTGINTAATGDDNNKDNKDNKDKGAGAWSFPSPPSSFSGGLALNTSFASVGLGLGASGMGGGGSGSIFGLGGGDGTDAQKEIELDALKTEGTTGGGWGGTAGGDGYEWGVEGDVPLEQEQSQPPTSGIDGWTEDTGTGEAEGALPVAMSEPVVPAEGATTEEPPAESMPEPQPAPEPMPTPAAQEEPPVSAVDPSTTEAPTDAPGEDGQEDGFAPTSKKKKGGAGGAGAGAGGTKKKKKK